MNLKAQNIGSFIFVCTLLLLTSMGYSFYVKYRANNFFDGELKLISEKVNYIFDENKLAFLKLPCPEDGKTECPNTTQIKEYLDVIFSQKRIISYSLFSGKGENLFDSNNKIDGEKGYNKLITNKEISKHFHSAKKINDEKFDIVEYYLPILDEAKNIKLIIKLEADVSDLYFNSIYLQIFALLAVLSAGFIFFNSRGKIARDSDRQIATNYDEAQKARKEVEQMKLEMQSQSQFLTNFTHELRTPLNSIIGFSGMIKDQALGQLGNPEYVRYGVDINNSGIHLLGLINDILDYSKAQAGRLSLNMIETDITKIINQCIAFIAPRASESGLELLTNISKSHFYMKIDPKRFKQIILNFLSNSVKFTNAGGKITVSIFPDVEGEMLYFEVQDSGVGMAEKDIPIALSVFGQVENKLSRKYEGTGLGLPFSKRLTELMGGKFEIKSQLEVGTSVRVGFPFDKELNKEYYDEQKQAREVKNVAN
jgi:signal transduction histidine kinase